MTFAQAMAYTQTRAPFTPLRAVFVNSAATFHAALSGLRAGDHVLASAPFTVPGETVIANRLTAPAVIGLGGFVTFSYTGGLNLPAVWVKNPAFVRMYGGIVTTNKTGGAGILMHGGQDFTWQGAKVRDCGGTGVCVFPVIGPVTNCDVFATVTNCGLNHAWDPHKEKGSGLHAVNLWDSDNAQPFQFNRFAFDVHDQPNGAAVEVGNGCSAPAKGNTLRLRAKRLTFVSKTQTGGNALQLWEKSGSAALSSLGLDVVYLEVDTAQGRALDCAATDAHGVTVEYGRALNTNLNPYLDQGRAKGVVWDRCGAVYKDVQP